MDVLSRVESKTAKNSELVPDPHFEFGVVKIQRNRENELTEQC
jgi:hypothetical protein